MRFSNDRNLWTYPAGANKINQEIGLMLRIMRLGDAFTSDIEKYYSAPGRRVRNPEGAHRKSRSTSSRSRPALIGRSSTGTRWSRCTLLSA